MRTAPKQNKIYHIYNRGNRKGSICLDKDDYDMLRRLINQYISNRNFNLICLCIMPNHYHLLLSQTGEVTIGKAMQIISCKYTKYFNKKYNLVGHLFQGPYKYKGIKDLGYFKWIIKYIGNNPKDLNVFARKKYTRFFKNSHLIKICEFLFSTEE
ncbi:MAG: transposase [Candidatus Dojkabacteria bacterium]